MSPKLKCTIVSATTITGVVIATLFGVDVSAADSKPPTWSVTIYGPDVNDADNQPWKVDLFDGVKCKPMKSITLAAKGKGTVEVVFRKGVGDGAATGALFHYEIHGVVPAGHRTMYWTGDVRPSGDKATFKISLNLGTGTGTTNLNKQCV